MKRKFLSLILVFAMTVSLLTVGTGAVEPTYGDTAGHWAESSIERWSGHGIIQGSNGLFDPNGQLTCAQLATILAKLLKLPAAKDAGFTDNTADAWYYDAINRCAAAGILNGNGDGTVTPEAPITRERAMVMLARALGIEPIRKPDLTKYTDAAQVSAYAQGYVAALIEAGIVGGVTADELAPQANINRASTVTILDRAISTYADEAGATVKVDGKGIVLVVAENVKITNAPEGTKIVVADGASGLTVNGKSVSNDQTYVVPEATTPSTPSGGGSVHSHSYDNTTLKCSCGQFRSDVVATVGDTHGYTTLVAAVEATKSGDTITLLKNVQNAEGMTVASGKNFTIDFNGFTYELNKPGAGSTGTETNGFQLLKNSTVVMKNGTITISKDNLTPATGGKNIMRIIQNYANLTLQDMIIDGTNQYGGAKYIMSFNNQPVLITGNTNITAAEGQVAFDADGNWGGYERCKVTINTTGTIVGNIELGRGYLEIQNANVKGGIVLCTSCGTDETVDQTKRISIAGGTFSTKPDDNYIAAGYEAKDNGNNTWTVGEKTGVTLVAQVGVNKYESLADAFAAAKDGDTVKLVADVTLAARVDVAFTGTIDLNGHTIRSTATCANGSVFNILSGTVTIKNGSMVGIAGPTGLPAPYTNECDVITVRSGATANLEELSISIDSQTGACAYAFDGGRINVKSGTYTNAVTQADVNGRLKGMLLNQADGKAQAIFVTGGTFHGANPASGDNSGNPSTFLAAGYQSTGSEGNWTVSCLFDGGSGTAEAPFVIQNAEQLKAFRDNVNAGNTFAGKIIKLAADIDLAGEEWAPIGTAEHPFSGTFDGNGKTISNLKITTGSYAGLFGYVSTATIKNVKLANAQVSGGERMASLIGRITDDATVTNCSNDAASSVTGSDSNTGGLIGEIVNGTVELSNLVNNAAVKNTKKSNSRAGGVVAQVTTGANVTLTNCTNNGAVNTNNGYAGGIVSAYQSGTMNIANCVNNGNLVGAYKGNMLGWYTSIRSITISSDTTEFDINAIGCIDIATTSDMSLYGKRYFVNRQADLTGVDTTAQTFSEIFKAGEIGTSPKALWDKLIAFYAFAAKTNSNFAGYPDTYWGMFNQPTGYSEPDWNTYFNGYNAECEREGRTADKLTKKDFNDESWRGKIVYLAP